MSEILLALVIICLVLNVATIILVRKSKTTINLDERDKKELKASFSENIEIISGALEKSNDKAMQNVDIRLNSMEQRISELNHNISQRLESIEKSQMNKFENIRITLERNVAAMQQSNDKKLNEIKQTVDEKLTRTLNDRFKESFKFLSDELEKVGKTIGEMQAMSKDVGNLTKVLSNVKTTGIFGEIQLGAIIEQILAPNQYLKNVVTNKNGREPVEFAIKMPGGQSGEVLLPIDSKFPYTIYNDMVAGYQRNDFDFYNGKQKELVQRIKGMAKDINEKYICLPYTTNFAVMFLPVEGLYAEVVKLGLVEELQRKYSVTVAGPTTMAALLNSLQMGFQTLAIHKKSNEVWNILGSVKFEFEKFNSIIETVRRRLSLADKDLDELVGRRSRAIYKNLKDVTVIESVYDLALENEEEG